MSESERLIMKLNFTLILIMLAVLFVGYGIGLFEMHVRRRKQIEKLEAALKMEQTKAESVPPPAAPPPSDLRLWTDANGTLNLELDNEPVNDPASATPEHRRRLISLLTQIRPWIEGGPVAPAAPQPAASTPVPAPQYAAPAPAPKPAVPAEPKSGEAAIAPPPTTIVGQINAVLQAQLAATPLADKRIQLVEAPNGGVRVYIGLKFYEGVDAVADPEIVAAIRGAIAEWEKKVG
jgi:hypothetical protein